MRIYNKLVRDKISNIINNDGNKTPIIRILDDDEYKVALNKKLQEEVDEYLADNNAEELADIVEVIYGILNVNNISIEMFEKLRNNKLEKRGGFKNKTFLEKVLEGGDKS